MRINKYRGFPSYFGKWVVGDLIHSDTREPHICVPRIWVPYKVDPESVGQCIGITDHSEERNELFEKDIIEFDNSEIGGEKVIGEIIWCDDQTLGCMGWGLWTRKGYLHTDFLGHIILLGNAFENKLEDFTGE